jgi:hypothetical protein
MRLGSFGFVTMFKDGQPCKHPGCGRHVSHACEKCGRIRARGEFKLPRSMWAPKGRRHE